jgi:hypothetical protein
METKIRNLRTGLQLLAFYCLALTLALAYVLMNREGNLDPSELIRTRGIVIEDTQGKPRILIGAPVPAVQGRIRTDTARVREIWGSRFAPKEDWFMDLYQTYQHGGNGIILLDENGHDRVAIGSPVPDPWFGKRIGASTGITLLDEVGLERSGYGLLKVDGVYRVNLGFDYPGKEGMTFSLDDNGQTGISIRDSEKSIFIGKADSINPFTGELYPFNGLFIKHVGKQGYSVNSFETPTLQGLGAKSGKD